MKSIPIFIIFVLFFVYVSCSSNDSVSTNPDTEFARVYFSDITYDMDVREVTGVRPSNITCKSVLTLGPGIRVLVSDGKNTLRLDIENASQDGLYPALVQYFNKNENRTYETNGPAMQNVSIIWRNNLEKCEFYFTDGPSVQLRSATNDIVQIDSLKIQALREDDF